jgi:hypothetical protein
MGRKRDRKTGKASFIPSFEIEIDMMHTSLQ